MSPVLVRNPRPDRIRISWIIGLALRVLISGTVLSAGAASLRLERFNPVSVGIDSALFSSIVSVCEDDSGRFYVLDRLEHKIFQFSARGKLLSSFGRKGQGPGDFDSPNRIHFSPSGHLVVSEDLFSLSLLQIDGVFIERIKLEGRLSPAFVGDNRFYAWIWREKDKQQVLVDRDNTIIDTFFSVDKDRFSVAAPDASGRSVMFNYGPQEYSPELIFAQYKESSAVGIGDRYEIRLLDSRGAVTARLSRDIPPPQLGTGERRFFIEKIETLGKKRNWPQKVTRELIRNIPEHKNYFDGIALSERAVFVFRIREDITAARSPFPADVFSPEGAFLGTVFFPEKPIALSQTRMYIRKTDSDDNVFLEIWDYRLIDNAVNPF